MIDDKKQQINAMFKHQGKASKLIGTQRLKAYEDISGRDVANVENVIFVSIDHQGNKVAHGVKK